MVKSLFLFLIFSQVYLYNCVSEDSIDLQTINLFYNDYKQEFQYDSREYQYLIIRGNINNIKTINFKIISEYEINPYFHFSDFTYGTKEISNIINQFKVPDVSKDHSGLNNTYSFSASYNGDYFIYCYLAINSTYVGNISFNINAKVDGGGVNSLTKLVLIILAIIAVLYLALYCVVFFCFIKAKFC